MRWHRLLLGAAAWLAVGVLLLGPLALMLWRSVTFEDVVMHDGKVHQALGRVEPVDDRYFFQILVPDGEGGTRSQEHEEDIEDVAEVRTRLSLEHYTTFLGDERTWPLLRNSAILALGGALLALLLGLPVAWIFARVRPRSGTAGPRVGWRAWLPAPRSVLLLLFVLPVVLPPFFMALAGARPLQGLLGSLLGLEGGDLQIAGSIVVFGTTLYPLYVLLVAPVIARIPAGPWEAARLLGGRSAAFRTVTLPAVLPATISAFLLAFVFALTDFSVPDVLGFTLPDANPTNVFSTEIFLEWNRLTGNKARGIAKCAPFVLTTLLILTCALLLLRRSQAFTAARGVRTRAPVRPGLLGGTAAGLVLAAMLYFTVCLPLMNVAGWAGSAASSSAGGSSLAERDVQQRVALFDLAGTIEQTPGSGGDLWRWLYSSFGAALLSMAIAVLLMRQVLRGSRVARAGVVAVGALALAWPGLVIGAGTSAFWQAVPGEWVRVIEGGMLRSIFALAAKFLPFALIGAWLGLREVRPGHEHAAALLGAGALARLGRIVAPTAWMGVAAGGLLVWVMAMRELDTIVLLGSDVLPFVLYNQVHQTRLAAEANLLFLCLLCFLLPGLLAVLLSGLRRRYS